MPNKSDNLVLDILKNIQGELSDMRRDMSSLARIETDVADIKTRVTRLEDIARLQRRDIAGMLVMFKSVAGVGGELTKTKGGEISLSGARWLE